MQTKHFKSPVLTMGNFDGVHLGHQKIFGEVIKRAKKLRGTSIVYTYSPHPAKVIARDARLKLIQTEKQKLATIALQNIDVCIVEKFTCTFAKLSPTSFFKNIILKRIAPRHIVIGYDFTFGVRRSGNIELLEKLARKNNIGITIIEPIFLNGVLLSSTQARNYVSAGRMKEANAILGRPYTLIGRVIHGRGIGGEIGFHTANIEPENELIPMTGVYITKTMGLPSVTNIGLNPTFGGKTISVETHILDFSKNLYGKKVEIAFYKRLRDEIMFATPLALKKQIELDIIKAKKYFKTK